MIADDYIVAVPSYRRSSTIAEHTLGMLARGKVPHDRVHVYVANEEEQAAYLKVVPPHLYHDICVTEPGLGPSRNAIQKRWPEDTPIAFCDDDIKGLVMRVDEKRLTPMEDVDSFFIDAFDQLQRFRLGLWGVCAVKNPFFMKDSVSADLKFCDGTFYGIRNTHDHRMLVDIATKEDIDRTCKFYVRDGGVLRFNYVAFDSRPYWTNPGGLHDMRTEAMNVASAQEIVRRYPHLATLNPKPDRMEIRLRDKRPRSKST